MKILPIAPLLLTALLPACGDTSEIRDEAEDVAREAGEMGDAVARWMEMSRDEFVAAWSDERDDLQARIADLKSKAGDAASEGRQQLDAAVAKLDESWSRLQDRGAELGDVADETWEDVRRDVVDAMADVRESLERAKARYDELSEEG